MLLETRHVWALVGTLLAACLTPATLADEAAVAEKPPVVTEFAEGELSTPMPADWKQVKPRNRIIELEFSIPAEDAEGEPARLTVMASGGTIPQNVARWVGQFTNHQAPEEGEVGAVEELEADGMKAHLVNLAGDFQDSPRGPFGPKVERKGYRMLGAIVETPESGNYFFKLVGPDALVAKQADAFRAMIQGIQRK